MSRTIKAGLIGFGTVGTGVSRIMLGNDRPHLRDRNFSLELVRIADLDTVTDRGIALPGGMLTDDAKSVLTDPDIDIVIELIGGIEPARTFTLTAFENGKSVVTANKALVARHGDELFRAAADAGVSYLFEASVAGGVPIIRSLQDSLNANTIESIYGILNGTTNYILTGMARDGADYGDVLVKAQELGYAEADPTADVAGHDARNKIVILARLAFGANTDVDQVYCEGIESIDVQDIGYAAELGYTVKLLAIAQRHDESTAEIRVHPSLVPEDSILAWVQDEFNAVEVYGDAVGRQVFYGKGAGMMPTSSAVVSDVVNAAADIVNGAPTNTSRIIASSQNMRLMDMAELRMRYYIRFMAKDQPGVLASISNILADEGISIESVIQIGTSDIDHVPLVIMTHEAAEGAMQGAMRRFHSLDSVREHIQLIRVAEG